jgi:hypothetical protein
MREAGVARLEARLLHLNLLQVLKEHLLALELLGYIVVGDIILPELRIL